MACTLTTREMVSALVLRVLRAATGFNWITEESQMDRDIGRDPIARRAFDFPVSDAVKQAGCDPNGFGPDDFQRAQTVKDIVDAVWAGVQN